MQDALTQLGNWGRILDVGCGSKGGLASYVPVSTVGLDLWFNVGRIRSHPRVTPVVGSGLALPLPTCSCDVVLCMDTLEHLASQERPVLMDELFRVVSADGLVIVGAPCGPEARAAEQRINQRYRASTGQDHPWLVEHLANEPLTAESLRMMVLDAAQRRDNCGIVDRTWRVAMIPNSNLALWERFQRERWLRHVHRLVYGPLWPLLRDRHELPVYRQVCIAYSRAQ